MSPRPPRDPLVWAAPGLILVALLVVALMAWFGHRAEPAPPPAPAAPSPPADTARVRPGEATSTPASEAGTPQRGVSNVTAPPDRIEREAEAETGDAQAACRLAVWIAQCDQQDASALALHMADDALERGLSTEAEREHVERLRHRLAAGDARCAGWATDPSEAFDAASRRWLESAARRGHVRAGLLLALHDPTTRRPVRAIAREPGFRVTVAYGNPDDYPPSDYLSLALADLLEHGWAAGDPLTLEAQILRAAPEPGMSGSGGELPLRQGDPQAFSLWVETWHRLFPHRALSTAIEAAHQTLQARRTPEQRTALFEEAEALAAAWPGTSAPPAQDFDLQPDTDLCETSDSGP